MKAVIIQTTTSSKEEAKKYANVINERFGNKNSAE